VLYKYLYFHSVIHNEDEIRCQDIPQADATVDGKCFIHAQIVCVRVCVCVCVCVCVRARARVLIKCVNLRGRCRIIF